jgi:hypothetical protein
MKFGILRERKSPPDRRVVFTRWMLRIKERYKDAFIQVESSDIRIFTDAQYRPWSFRWHQWLWCFIWVKEVPVDFNTW